MHWDVDERTSLDPKDVKKKKANYQKMHTTKDNE